MDNAKLNHGKYKDLVISTPWDFRSSQELSIGKVYEEKGYIIQKGEINYLDLLKEQIEAAFFNFNKTSGKGSISLEEAHQLIEHNESNNLRLHVMQQLFVNTSFHRNYFNAAKDVIHTLCGNELAMQKRPGISINLPHNPNDALPIHADTWNGVSPFELNIWIPFVDCENTMSLYILKREKYHERLRDSKGLLKLSSDDLFKELRDDLTWIPVKYGQILAFDQSLPHGYSVNQEKITHWSMNCRFKGLHTPYWDKKLGEYFMPITVKTNTRLGMNYKHPENWV